MWGMFQRQWVVAGCGLVGHDGALGVGAEWGQNYRETLPTTMAKDTTSMGSLAQASLRKALSPGGVGEEGHPRGHLVSAVAPPFLLQLSLDPILSFSCPPAAEHETLSHFPLNWSLGTLKCSLSYLEP